MPEKTSCRQATIDDLDQLSMLFNDYRVFYEQVPDRDAARQFIHERFRHHQSVIFIGYVDNTAAGFVQLYPIFSSVRMNRVWLLNDLYVARSARGQGLGEALLESAAEFARSTGASYLTLETGADNTTAQRLYERHGWVREGNYHYVMDFDKQT